MWSRTVLLGWGQGGSVHSQEQIKAMGWERSGSGKQRAAQLSQQIATYF